MYFFVKNTLVTLMISLCAVSHIPRCATIYKILSLFDSMHHSEQMHCHDKESKSEGVESSKNRYKKKPDCECKTHRFVKATTKSIVRSHSVSLVISAPKPVFVNIEKSPLSIHLGIDPPPPRMV